MATQTFEKIAKALAHLAIIRQATSETIIRDLCVDAATTIAAEVDDLVILVGVDPAAELQKIKFDPFYEAIDECDLIADGTSSPAVKSSCLAIAQSLTAVIHKLI
ncbi:hypothetical protein BH11BAC1_BH11BAC1_24650 [soil metagenome]